MSTKRNPTGPSQSISMIQIQMRATHTEATPGYHDLYCTYVHNANVQDTKVGTSNASAPHGRFDAVIRQQCCNLAHTCKHIIPALIHLRSDNTGNRLFGKHKGTIDGSTNAACRDLGAVYSLSSSSFIDSGKEHGCNISVGTCIRTERAGRTGVLDNDRPL